MDVVDIPWVVEAELTEVVLPLVRPLASANGTMTQRTAVLLRLTDQSENEGWAECGADYSPYYSPESPATAWKALETIAIPGFLRSGDLDEDALATHPMARATALGALLDLTAARNNIGFSSLIGATRTKVEVGAVLGANHDMPSLLEEASRYVSAGYKRLKLKISPEFDLKPLTALRALFPDLQLAADANGSYTPSQWGALQPLDDLDLAFLEQPFPAGDLEDHADLARRIKTPICLDESLTDVTSVAAALDKGAASIVTIKPGKLGGADKAMEAIALCEALGVPAWIGGLVETGVGRTQSLALAGLPGCTMPADLSASHRYFARDLVTPPWTVDDGYITPLASPTTSIIDKEAVSAFSVRTKTFERV